MLLKRSKDLSSRLFSILLFSLMAVPSVFSWAEESSDAVKSAETLLIDMSRALRQTNYSGVFTYEHGGTLDAFRVSNQVTDSDEKLGQLEYLNGPERAIVRQRFGFECLPLAERLSRGEDDVVGLDLYYQFYLKGQQRVAGRKAQVLHLVPRDEYRHGYTLFIDEETSLPLLLMTVNNRRRVLERMQFSDLKVESPDASKVEPLTVQQASKLVESKQDLASGCGEPAVLPESWQISWVPPGFVLTARRIHKQKGESLTFSDGLAAFSVFVQPQVPALSYQGTAQRGASLVMMLPLKLQGQPYVVSIVGEIPGITAERVAAGVGSRQVSLGSP